MWNCFFHARKHFPYQVDKITRASKSKFVFGGAINLCGEMYLVGEDHSVAGCNAVAIRATICSYTQPLVYAA
jgi:hypothetical protein